MRKLFGCVALLAIAASMSAAVAAQTCDVTYSAETETMAGQNVSDASVTLYGVPMSEVDFNHARQMKVLNAMSKEQDAKKDGMYRTDVTEYRACDGGAKTKVDSGSASIQGISYAGTVRITDEALKQGKVINDHHRDRSAKGEKHAWDHGKAKKVKRNDVGVKLKD